MISSTANLVWKGPDKKKMQKSVVQHFLKKNYLNFWVCYFTLGNSGQNKSSSLEILQNFMTSLGNETKSFVICSLLPLKILVIFCSTPGNPIFYFFNIPGIANFVTSTEQKNYRSWDIRENNLEYFLFGISISLLAVCSSFPLFYLWVSCLKKALKPTKFYLSFWFFRKLTL